MNGLVLVGHGSHTSPSASDPIHSHADRLRRTDTFDTVHTAFWQGDPHLREVLRTLRSETLTVVPVMMADGYFTDRVFPRELRLSGDETFDCAKTVQYTEPVGTHPRLVDVIVSQAEAITMDREIGPDTGLAVVGHGTNRHPESSTTTLSHVDRLRIQTRFDEVQAFFLDEKPAVSRLTESMATDDIIVVPLFIADGPHTQEDIPQAIGLPLPPTSPVTINGHRIWYSNAVGTNLRLSEIILDLATGKRVKVSLNERSGGPPDSVAAIRRFEHWLNDPSEHTGGTGRQWGELLISLQETGAEETRYTVCHYADRDRPVGALDVIDDLWTIRETSRSDDTGRFRPLSGARTLPTGWVVDDLTIDDLARTIEIIYPASIVNWYRERQGRLDITPFDTVSERHTGRFGSLDTIPETTRQASITACCSDCVRDPRWTDNSNHSDEEIPCREPCSFLLAAMEAFRDIDRPVTVPEPIDNSVPYGLVDQPGNRYRSRFLRSVESQSSIRGEPL